MNTSARHHRFTQMLVTLWTHLYTIGLPAAVRDARRDEIASDLWEHWQDADAACASPVTVAAVTIARLVLGMPADLSWRVATSRQTGPSQAPSLPRMHTRPTSASIASALWSLAFWADHLALRLGRIISPAVFDDASCTGWVALGPSIAPSHGWPVQQPVLPWPIRQRLRATPSLAD
jgi:hypothetical protein